MSKSPARSAEKSLDPQKLAERRLWMLLLLSGIFLGCLAMLNLLGISRFLVLGSYEQGVGWQWGVPAKITFALAVGVLPYPLTFLCTDLISEFYGRRTANIIVLIGVVINVLIICFLQIGAAIPGFVPIDAATGYPPLPEWDAGKQAYIDGGGWTFFHLRHLAMGAVAASMIAYLAAQFIDVQLFHFWKHVTKGRHLWLRNNGSTIVSQFVDTFAVITITHFYAHALGIDDENPWPVLWTFILTGYAFKLAAALIDTPIIYAAAYVMKKYLHLHPEAEHRPGIVISESGGGGGGDAG